MTGKTFAGAGKPGAAKSESLNLGTGKFLTLTPVDGWTCDTISVPALPKERRGDYNAGNSF